ncbi:MAG: PfkB family carbohydrate kinase [bacterium]
MAPEFLSIGHVTHDLSGREVRLGGAALYASITARRLGKEAALLTSFGPDFGGRAILEGIRTKVVGAPCTSTFRNVYRGGERFQSVHAVASTLDLRGLPSGWKKADLVYLCPVLHEIPMAAGERFPASRIGVAPQGWLRAWDGTGRIRFRRWERFERLLERATLVIVSEKDVEGDPALVDAFRSLAPICIVTRAEKGAFIHAAGQTLHVGAYPAAERDPTGAGDCFGAAFLIRYATTGNIEEAGRFAACVGAFVVEGEGVAGIPDHEAVIARMRSHPVAGSRPPR